jgi:hypothetical protein
VIFTISTFNFAQKEEATTNLNLGIALLSSALVGLLLFLLQIPLDKKNQNEVRPLSEKSMLRSLRDELKKISKRLKIDSTISKKFAHLEQEIKLLGFDTAILATIFFVVTIYVALISSGSLSILKMNAYLLVGFFYLIIPMAAMIITLQPYVSSIISSERRFSKKIDSLSYLLGTVSFVVMVWIFLGTIFLVGQIVPKFVWPSWSIYTIMGVILIGTIALAILKIKPDITRYFEQEYTLLTH